MSLTSIFGVIVLYESNLEQSKTFNTINNSLSFQHEKLEVLVYDNSSQPKYNKEYFEYGNFKIYYMHNASNPGIGKAYNVGAKLAQELNKKWLLLLDQDTSFPQTIIRSYLEAIVNNPKIKLFSPVLHLSNGTIFSPCNYMLNRGFPKKRVKPGINSLKYTTPVNSGILVDIDAFWKVGGYNEKIKLDFSDFQFIEKFRKFHDKFFLLNEICIQDFSNDITDSLSLERRFDIYCMDARSCISYSALDSFFYFINSFFRAVKLSFRTKKISFLRIWKNNFIYVFKIRQTK